MGIDLWFAVNIGPPKVKVLDFPALRGLCFNAKQSGFPFQPVEKIWVFIWSTYKESCLITVLFTTFSICRKIWTGFILPKREIHSKRPFKRADPACCLHNCCFFSDSNWIWRIIWKWSFWFTPGIPSFDTACATGLPSGSLLSLEKARRFSRWHSGCTQPEPSTSPCVSPTWEKLMTGQETQGVIFFLKISQNTCYFYRQNY